MRQRTSVLVGSAILVTTLATAGSGCSTDAQPDGEDGDEAAPGGAPSSGGASTGGSSSGGGPTGGESNDGGGGQGGSPDPGDGCSVVDASVSAHVDEMATAGWAAIHVENGLEMYGCVGDEAPRDCLSEKTNAASTEYGSQWAADLPGTTLRILHTSDAASSFATRSSPDGRFVAHGLEEGTAQGNAEILDLERGVAIGVDAMYDPGFFPDGSGWVLLGGDSNVCVQGVLTSEPSAITTNELGCADLGQIGLNPSLGAEPGGDYQIIHGTFHSDNGGRGATHGNPRADFGPSAHLQLTSLLFDGSEFLATETAELTLPYEGNFALSPSGSLVLSRLGSPQDDTQRGYRLRSLAWNDDHTALESTELAHYCIDGGDPSFSYDERWAVLHHYVEPSDAEELGFDGAQDAGFAPYQSQGAANVYLVELATGRRTRITRMAPGQYALYPHFRADGWIYFVVRTLSSDTEHLVASDAALRSEP